MLLKMQFQTFINTFIAFRSYAPFQSLFFSFFLKGSKMLGTKWSDKQMINVSSLPTFLGVRHAFPPHEGPNERLRGGLSGVWPLKYSQTSIKRPSIKRSPINLPKFASHIYCKFDLYSTVTSIKRMRSPF